MFFLKKLSLIIPCYNEGKKLTKNVEKIVSFMEENFLIDYEIMIVNDGSTDNTIDDVLLLKEKYPNIIRLIHYKDNKGKGYAVKRGILDANGDISRYISIRIQYASFYCISFSFVIFIMNQSYYIRIFFF